MLDPGRRDRRICERLESSGSTGPMGFYESIDFTRREARRATRRRHLRLHGAPPGHDAAGAGQRAARRVMQRRFHSDPRVRAVESLLFERIPMARLRRRNRNREPAPRTADGAGAGTRLDAEDAAAACPPQGNGRYSLMVTNSGGGYSRWNEFDLTRWRSDTTLDPWGSFVLSAGYCGRTPIWSPRHHPFGRRTERRSLASRRLAPNSAATLLGIETVMEVAVAPRTMSRCA